jgi:hypothetical protein
MYSNEIVGISQEKGFDSKTAHLFFVMASHADNKTNYFLVKNKTLAKEANMSISTVVRCKRKILLSGVMKAYPRGKKYGKTEIRNDGWKKCCGYEVIVDRTRWATVAEENSKIRTLNREMQIEWKEKAVALKTAMLECMERRAAAREDLVLCAGSGNATLPLSYGAMSESVRNTIQNLIRLGVSPVIRQLTTSTLTKSIRKRKNL